MHLSTQDVCYGNKLVERFVLEVCIGIIDEAIKNGTMDKLREDGYELRITLNGHEIDAESYFKSLDERLATHIECTAAAMVEGKLKDKLNSIQENLNEIDRLTGQVVKEQFPLAFPYDDD